MLNDRAVEVSTTIIRIACDDQVMRIVVEGEPDGYIRQMIEAFLNDGARVRTTCVHDIALPTPLKSDIASLPGFLANMPGVTVTSGEHHSVSPSEEISTGG